MKLDKILNPKEDYSKFFNILAGSRILFLLMSLFSATIDLGLSFSIVDVVSTATNMIYDLLMVTILNIIVLILYITLVKKENNQSNFLIYIMEILTSAFGVLGLYAFFRYINMLNLITTSTVIGIVGLIDLLLINILIGSYFFKTKIHVVFIEAAIFLNLIVLVVLYFS